MGHAGRIIATNALFGYVGSVGLIALRLVTKLVLIRSLDLADFGRVITIQNVQAIALMVASLGIGDGVLRFVAMYAQDGTGRAKGVVHQVARFLTVSGVLSTVLLLAAARGLAPRLGLGPQGGWGVALAALAVMPLLFGDMLGYTFLGLNRTIVKVGLLDFSRGLLTLGGYVLLAVSGWATFRGALTVQLAAALLSAGCILVAFRRAPEFKRQAEPVSLRVVLAYTLPIFASLIVGGIPVGSGIPLVLAAREAPETVGMYAIALTLAPLLQLPAVALENAAFPVWAGASGMQRHELKRSFTSLTRWGIILALLVYVPLAVAPRDCLELLFGNQYMGPMAAIEVALGATFFTVLVGPTQGILQAHGLTRPILVVRTVSGMFALAVAWPLVARWGLMGAVVAWASSTVIGNGISAVYVFRLHGINPVDSRYVRTMIAGAIGGLVSLAIVANGGHGVGTLIGIAAANALTLALVGRALGAWHPAELAALVRQSSPER